MRTFISWLLGFLLGSSLGTALVLLFAPTSGQELINGAKRHYQNSLDAGHDASVAKRVELEQVLQKLRKERGLEPSVLE